jgi:hypothetical protein
MWIRKEQLNYESDCGTREINGSFACECHRKLEGTRGEAKLRNLHAACCTVWAGKHTLTRLIRNSLNFFQQQYGLS